MRQFVWGINRLRCMSLAEIGHRLLRAARMQAERWGAAGSQRVPAPVLTGSFQPWIALPAKVDAAPYLAAADRIAAGRFDVFALRDIELGSPPRWNRDPKTGIQAPLIFGKLLDYRDSARVGDIKYLWEPNRHLHLVTLAQAYSLTGAARYFHVLREHLASWFAGCPYGRGANWSSALEPAIRLVNWALAWQLLGGVHSPLFRDAEGLGFRNRWLRSIYQHMRFVRGHFSLYSSANNHLLGEAAGVFIGCVTWPYWPDTRRWRRSAMSLLEHHALLQNAADGVNLEQAVAYQHFTFDLMLLPMAAGRANGHAFSAGFMARMEGMLEYLASIMDVGGNVPMFGDSDDGFLVRLSQERGFCKYRSLLATGGVLFKRGDFKSKAGRLDDKTRWLLGDSALDAFETLSAGGRPLPVRRAYPQGGYYILGCDLETAREIRLVADAGPVGYRSIAAHGHADALSFTLSLGGQELLVDPGTYAYHTEPAWRQYFRGTAAHSTVRIDDRDQSQSGGNFMWLKKARAHCGRWECAQDQDVFEGWHDGYTRLADPVVHHRRITLHKNVRRITVEDSLRMQGAHDVELNFHCSEHCSVDSVAGGYALSLDGRRVILRLPALSGSTAEILKGSESPIRGWVSRSFDTRIPAPTIVWRARCAGDVVLTTHMECEL